MDRSHMLLLRCFCIICMVSMVGGCSSAKVATPDPREAALLEVFEMYSMFAKAHQKPPTQLADLTRRDNETLYPAGVRALKAGDYVVVWGAVVGESSVLAYEKDAPKNGGLVVQADGFVKKMSAAELEAALKHKG